MRVRVRVRRADDMDLLSIQLDSVVLDGGGEQRKGLARWRSRRIN